MNTEELMIGDLVYIGESDDFHGYISKVVIINGETGYITVHIPNMHLHDVFVEDIQPIQITEEILEKNGFEKYENGLYKICGNIVFNIHSYRLDMYNYDSKYLPYTKICDCKYIHELQHVLKLCGIEKEIIL